MEPSIISRCLLIILLSLSTLGIAEGYKCFQCSYGLWSEGDRRQCIENPRSLGSSHYLNCNSSSYCVLSEVFDIQRHTVTSYFRSCSGTSWGNECAISGGQVTCKVSCKGSFCNENEVGTRTRAYLDQYADHGHSWNKTSPFLVSYVSLFLCLILTLIFL